MAVPVRIALLSVALALAGGFVSSEEAARIDDKTCQSYGAKKGSEPYIKCRTEQARMRNSRLIAVLE